MSEPFVAEIRIFPGNYAPRHWAFCDGALLPIAQNTPLFAVIGTVFGGDGRTTTALPDLRGRVPMHCGRGPGLTSRRLGERGGVEAISLLQSQMPKHHHKLAVGDSRGRDSDPKGNVFQRTNSNIYVSESGANLTTMAPQVLKETGAGKAHNNMQPSIVMNFIIALSGIFPSKS